ncbi:MAG: TIGR00730 family Rossman fold protein [Deltaproteobacteria bacterium]|nr:TIGR00730 family Rossman fold protein [Deltaproteobacteria bacterium]
MRRVCVFCGSSPGGRSEYRAAAEALAQALARRGLGVVYGGGNVGLMGAVADAMLAAGGEAIGVIPQALMDKELGHPGLTRMHVVGSMHERKAMMADLADGFVALPGGFGTFEEFCEVLTWTQLGFQKKPCGLLDVDGFYDGLLALFDRAVAERFVRPDHRAMVLTSAEPDALLEQMEAWRPPTVPKWIDRKTS